MARYTRLENKDIQEISTEYTLKALEFEPIDGGHGNSSFLLNTTHGKYVLTVFDDKSFDYVRCLGDLLLHLEKHEFITTRLVMPSKGKDPITVYLDKPVMVKEYIAGEVRADMDENMLKQLGAAMAKLHKTPPPDFLETQHPYGRQFFLSVTKTGIDLEYEKWLAARTEFLEDNLPTHLPSGLVHGDLFYDNVLFDGEEFKAIIDFEEACHYPFIFDIGMGMVGSCTKDGKIDFALSKAFVAGYESVRALETDEKETLQLFVDYAATATSYWRFWKYNIHEPMPENADEHRIMMGIAEDMKGMDKGEFMDMMFSK